jgi:hypothetical protein
MESEINNTERWCLFNIQPTTFQVSVFLAILWQPVS